VWDEIQYLQSDVCFAQEVAAYYRSNSWRDAKTVLDVGTGNGYFLHRLWRVFPDKHFTAIDSSPDFVTLARRRLEETGACVAVRDFFDEVGSYDFVITRLLWQHLPLSRLEQALSRLEVLTRPGGSVLIMDSVDGAREFRPDLRAFDRIMAAYNKKQHAEGRSREVCDLVVAWAERSDGWRVGSDVTIVVPSSFPGHLARFARLYSLWLELFEIIADLDVDLPVARAEIDKWFKGERRYTQLGLRLIRLDRVA
jgi:SAM-dependent methyltransferase